MAIAPYRFIGAVKVMSHRGEARQQLKAQSSTAVVTWCGRDVPVTLPGVTQVQLYLPQTH